MRKLGALLVLASLVACDGESSTTEDVEKVRSAADAMEESGSFAVELTIDLEMPEPFTSVETTIIGSVDLSNGQSRFEARSSDDDRWTELVVDGGRRRG